MTALAGLGSGTVIPKSFELPVVNEPTTVSIDALAGAVIDQLTNRTDGVVVEMLVYVALAVVRVVSLDFTVSAGAVIEKGVLIVLAEFIPNLDIGTLSVVDINLLGAMTTPSDCTLIVSFEE